MTYDRDPDKLGTWTCEQMGTGMTAVRREHTKRLGFLYPPAGAEHELYLAGESLGCDVQVSVIGVRISGGDDEHAPHHLSATGSIDNLLLSARVMAHLSPASLVWACTSGSFIDGLGHARAQAAAMGKAVGAPASSTSLAFLAALSALGIGRVGVLASYPEATSRAFTSFLAEGGIETTDMTWLDAPSGPAAAQFGDDLLLRSASKVRVPNGGALLVPDTAVPSLALIGPLENRLGCPVLTANQVTVWEGARLAGITRELAGLGALFAAGSRSRAGWYQV